MKGKIVAINTEARRAAVQTLHGDYTVFEVKGDESLDYGDVLDGFLEALGPETVTNVSGGTHLRIVIRAAETSREKAIQMVADGIFPQPLRRRKKPVP